MSVGANRGWMWWLRAGGIATLLVSSVWAIVMLALEVEQRLAALERANSDNSQWVMMQTEVEALRLQIALYEAREPAPPNLRAIRLIEVRRWFNVLYSRVSMLEESGIYAPMLARPDYGKDHMILRQYLDRLVAVIDGPDDQLLRWLPGFAQDLPRVREAARALTLRALSDFAADSDSQRTSMSDTLVRLAVAVALLMVFLVALTTWAVRVANTSEARAENLRQTGGRLSTIVSNSADGIVVTDPAGKVLDFNPAAEAIFGVLSAQVTERSAMGMLFADGEGGEQERRLIAALGELNPARGPLRIELDARRADGSTFPAEVSIAMSRPEQGLYVAFVRDISDRRRAERELTDARDRALAGQKAKAEFLAVMSHEMRTPLNGLLGSIDIISRSTLDTDQQTLVGVMKASGDILLSHVNAVLDVSRSEAGPIRIVETPFDLDQLVEEAVANQAGLASAGGNRIEILQVTGPVGQVRADRDRLRQILLNLIGNAVKFTENGSITIETERLPNARGGKLWVEFRVIDTGIGIPDDDLTRIFDDFVTLDTRYDRIAGGTGLGLGIARRLADAMGGDIGAESVEGEGSLFWLRLPLAPADSPALPLPDGADPALPALPAPDEFSQPTDTPLSVLVVEDNEINRFLLRRYLVDAGHDVTEAVDGIQGVELAAKSAFDVILMDISMPRLDGIEATRRIRAGGGPSAKSRILALTAHALPEEQAQFRAAGMEAGLTKPVVRIDLLRAITDRNAPAQSALPKGIGAGEPLVDARALSDLVGQIGHVTAASLVQRLVAEGDQIMAQLARLPTDTPPDEVERLIHPLAGTCGTFGTRQLRGVLAEVEAAALRGPADELARLSAILPAVWAETRAELLAVIAALRPDPAV